MHLVEGRRHVDRRDGDVLAGLGGAHDARRRPGARLRLLLLIMMMVMMVVMMLTSAATGGGGFPGLCRPPGLLLRRSPGCWPALLGHPQLAPMRLPLLLLLLLVRLGRDRAAPAVVATAVVEPATDCGWKIDNRC